VGSTDATVRTTSGRTLAYTQSGPPDGVPLFYFHGIPGSRLDFHQPYIRSALDGAGVRIIGVDRPGYGGSDFQPHRRYRDWPDDVATVANALGIDPFGIIAYSGGGPYAIACALRLAERVTFVGIVSGVGPAEMPHFRDGMSRTDALMLNITRWARPVARFAVSQAKRQAERSPEKFSAQFDKELSPPDVAIHRESGMRDAVRAAFLESTRNGSSGIVEDYRIWSAPTGLDYTAVRCSTTIWQGDADAIVPVHHAHYVADAIPGAKLEIMSGVGHLHTAARWHDFVIAAAAAH
jgi:pimeloyl-ACP methyl ester carboxylesterase